MLWLITTVFASVLECNKYIDYDLNLTTVNVEGQVITIGKYQEKVKWYGKLKDVYVGKDMFDEAQYMFIPFLKNKQRVKILESLADKYGMPSFPRENMAVWHSPEHGYVYDATRSVHVLHVVCRGPLTRAL